MNTENIRIFATSRHDEIGGVPHMKSQTVVRSGSPPLYGHHLIAQKKLTVYRIFVSGTIHASCNPAEMHEVEIGNQEILGSIEVGEEFIGWN
jgi:hypothetical protein